MPDWPSGPTLATGVVERVSRLGRPGRILGPEMDLLRAAGRTARLVQRDLAYSAAWGPNVRRRVYGRIWEDAAQELGASLAPVPGDFFSCRHGSATTMVRFQQVVLDDAVHLLLSLDKVLAKEWLRARGIPVLPHLEFDAYDSDAGLEFLSDAGKPCVVKPADGTSGGQGVTCGVASAEEFHRAVVWARRWSRRLLIEERAIGEELRFLFLDGTLLGVVRRRSPTVVGDGHSSVMALIAEANGRRARADGLHGMSPLTVDLDCIVALRHAGLALHSVLAEGQVAVVKTMVNQSGAADTDTIAPGDLSPELLDSAAAAAGAIGLRLASVEIVTPDPTRSLADAGGVVLEINGAPGLHYHYLVSDASSVTRIAVPILECALERSAHCRA
jgi:D-alanine-D-alanine ligase-like ATP-grasp enzyme